MDGKTPIQSNQNLVIIVLSHRTHLTVAHGTSVPNIPFSGQTVTVAANVYSAQKMPNSLRTIVMGRTDLCNDPAHSDQITEMNHQELTHQTTRFISSDDQTDLRSFRDPDQPNHEYYCERLAQPSVRPQFTWHRKHRTVYVPLD
ncbi:hypothetical protein J6590_056324 [Homalodisca vitripennis]|nr:hypothetical protein J6590_056324 [Homalodisca vitripennis]